MKSVTRLLLALTLIGPAVGNVYGQPATEKAPANAKSLEERFSYALGMNIGRDMKRQGFKIDPSKVAEGMAAALGEGKTTMTEKELQATFAEFQSFMRTKLMATQKEAAATNLAKGTACLDANEKKPGVKTLPSGLQYRVIKSGTGAMPKKTDTVKTHYHGTLIDGTVFDSSVERKQPATFPVGGVIKGWTERFQLMKVGDKWQLFLPHTLAYGERGAGEKIGPNSVLIFEIELLGIQ